MPPQNRDSDRRAGTPPELARLERAKVAASAVFLLNGMTFATWAGRIPTVRDELGLTPGELGLVLLIGAAGSLVGLPFAGRLVAAYGAARTVLALSLIHI